MHDAHNVLTFFVSYFDTELTTLQKFYMNFVQDSYAKEIYALL